MVMWIKNLHSYVIDNSVSNIVELPLAGLGSGSTNSGDIQTSGAAKEAGRASVKICEIEKIVKMNGL